MSTITTRAGKGSPLTNNEVDANFTNLNTDKAELSGAAFTGNITFTDNSKAIFGAGSDLQIYHDGGHSYISDTGSGNLKIKSGAGFDLQTTTGENYLDAVENGAINLYYDNSKKLATTATGIDVTGTATMDGLTVSGAQNSKVAYFDDSSEAGHRQLQFTSSNNGQYWDINSQGTSGGLGGVLTLSTRSIDRFNIASNGDISFYEDTGTTPKFFWDASAESLGIGTSTPQQLAHINGTGISYFRATGGTGNTGIDFGQHSNGNGYIWHRDSASVIIGTASTERVRISSAGHTTFGTTNLTPADSAVNGTSILSDGRINHNAQSQPAAVIGRTGTDGAIADFRKNGTTVGSIGVNTSGLYIADAGVGFRFDSGGTDDIIPCNATGGAADASINLGSSGARFKDLYLSGIATVGVNGTEYANNYLRFKPTGAAYIDHNTVGQAINFRLSNASSLDKTVMTLTSAGNVGIGGIITTGTAGTTTANSGDIVLQNNRALRGYNSLNNSALKLIERTNFNDIAIGDNQNNSSENIKLYTSAVERMRIDSAGRVGIGTASPNTGYALDVSGAIPAVMTSTSTATTPMYGGLGVKRETNTNGNGTGIGFILEDAGDVETEYAYIGGIIESNTAGSEDGGLVIATTLNNVRTQRMRIDSAGNVLVGKTTTAIGTQGIRLEGNNGKIEATRSGNVVTAFNRTGSEGTISEWMKDGTTVGSIGTNVGRLSIGSGDTGVLFAGDIDAIYPANGIAARDSAIDLGVSGARFKDLYLSGKVQASYIYRADASGAGLHFTTNAIYPTNETAALSDGTESLGAAAYRFKDLYITGLDVTYSTYNKISSYFSGSYISGFKFSDLNGGIWYDAATDDLTVSASHANSQLILESGGSESMRIDASGRLLVGYTAADGVGGAPSDNNFSELGKGYINLNRDDTATARQVQFGKNGVVAGYIQTAGSTTSYVTSSDQRLKENIADADDAGSKVDAIQVRKYDWKADGSHQDYGMIAQELQAVAPEAVSGDADSEEMMGVDYSKLVPMLIKEIQSLRNRVAQLEE